MQKKYGFNSVFSYNIGYNFNNYYVRTLIIIGIIGKTL